MQQKLIDSKQLAEWLGVSRTKVDHMRCDGTGPSYFKVGLQVRYRVADVEAWIERQTRTRVWDFDDGEAA